MSSKRVENGIEGMVYMLSQSTGDGSVGITVTFEPGTDLHAANVLVQNRVARAEPSLPAIVRSFLAENNVQVASGTLGGLPNGQPGAQQFSVQTQGRLNTAEEFGRIVVSRSEGGGVTRV